MDGLAILAISVALACDEIQSANFRERREFGFLDCGNAEFQILDRGKRANGALANNFCGDFGAQAFDVAQAQSQSQALSAFLLKLFERAKPIRAVTSMGLTFKPCRCASFTSVAGW